MVRVGQSQIELEPFKVIHSHMDLNVFVIPYRTREPGTIECLITCVAATARAGRA